jgi:multidrug efflux pump subunit AcrA (membrane-fusion protein)
MPPSAVGSVRSEQGTYDQDNRVRLAEGRIELIDNQIDQDTCSFPLKAIFPNEDERLWPGEFVNAWLQLGIGRAPIGRSGRPDGRLRFCGRIPR